MQLFDSLRALIEKLDDSVEAVNIPSFWLGKDSTLEDIRNALKDGPLGTSDRDIFFPTWTKSIHVLRDSEEINEATLTVSQIESMKFTVETTEQLQAMLAEEQKMPGTYFVVLQQCRSKRYSRKTPDTTIGLAQKNSTIGMPPNREKRATDKGQEKNYQGCNPTDLHRNSKSVRHHYGSHYHFSYQFLNSNQPSTIYPSQHTHPQQECHKPYSKRSYSPNEQFFPLSAPSAPYVTPTPYSMCPPIPQTSFDISEQAYFIYQDGSQYNLLAPTPVMHPVYAIPWNLGFNYVPVPSSWLW